MTRGQGHLPLFPAAAVPVVGCPQQGGGGGGRLPSLPLHPQPQLGGCAHSPEEEL